MEDLSHRIGLARADAGELERLVLDYLPFIKKEVGRIGGTALEYDDKLSLGMLVFTNCVRQYEAQRGGFLSYAAVCIRNRLLDETRRLGRGGAPLSLDAEEEHAAATVEERASLEAYSCQRERRELREEIDVLAAQLARHGLSFGELARICPRQRRSRALCARLARQVCGDAALREAFQRDGRLPQGELAGRLGISAKTVEKHRRYIVALVVILLGDYPGIGSYIPGYREVP